MRSPLWCLSQYEASASFHPWLFQCCMFNGSKISNYGSSLQITKFSFCLRCSLRPLDNSFYVLTLRKYFPNKLVSDVCLLIIVDFLALANRHCLSYWSKGFIFIDPVSKYHTNDPRAFEGFSNVSLKCHKPNLHHLHYSKHYLLSSHSRLLNSERSMAFLVQRSKCLHNPPHKANMVSAMTAAPHTQSQLMRCFAFCFYWIIITTKSNLKSKEFILSYKSEPTTNWS